MIKRKLISEVWKLMKVFPVVGITGPRQVGKTTLIQHFTQSTDLDAIYLDMEDVDDLAKIENPKVFFKYNEDKTIILDEIQHRPDLFPVLRGIIDQNRRPGRFIISGSASPSLLRQSAESLTGRIAYMQLFPILVNELPDGISQNDLWLRGGYPLSLLAESAATSMIWRKNYINAYAERELSQFGVNVDPVLIKKLWSMLAHFQGNVWNASNFSKSMGVSAPTVRRYLDLMVQAYLIRELPSYHINIKKRLVKAPKIYLRDTGMLHALIQLQDFNSLLGHYLLGNSWEGFVIEQLAGNLKDEQQIFYYRTHQGTEADLVMVENDQPKYALEIKFSNSPKLQRGFLQAIEDLGTAQNLILTPSADTYPLADNVMVMSVEDFIEKEWQRD